MSALQWLSTAALPLFIVLTLAFSFAKKRDPYEAFLEGAKGGAKIVFQTMPYVVAMVFAVKIFQASGLFDWVGRLLGPLLEPLGIPPEVVPIAALRPFSGGGSSWQACLRNTGWIAISEKLPVCIWAVRKRCFMSSPSIWAA